MSLPAVFRRSVHAQRAFGLDQGIDAFVGRPDRSARRICFLGILQCHGDAFRLDSRPLESAELDPDWPRPVEHRRSEEHTSELQSLMRISYAVFCLKKKKNTQ